MIGHVADPGDDIAGLLYYLFSPGRRDEHVNPHLVGGWEDPSGLEPPAGASGERDFRRLTGLLEDPVVAIGKRAPAKYVWHCVLRAAPGDPPLVDGAWMEISARVMDRTGLSERGREQDGVRWIAVYHGDQHVHILATLARQDGHRARRNNLYWKISAALAEVEKEYGLRELVRDKTADKAPTQAEMAKARRTGQAETARVVLRRIVQAAAAAARTDAGFFAAVEARGALARTGKIAGYSSPFRVTPARADGPSGTAAAPWTPGYASGNSAPGGGPGRPAPHRVRTSSPGAMPARSTPTPRSSGSVPQTHSPPRARRRGLISPGRLLISSRPPPRPPAALSWNRRPRGSPGPPGLPGAGCRPRPQMRQ